MAYAPNAAVDTGTTPSTIPTGETPIGSGGTILETSSNPSLVAATQLQGPVPQRNPFEEVNLVIGEFARNYSISPMAAWRLISRVGQAIHDQTYHG